MTRRLTNQDAFDGAMLNLINQGHSCVSASGKARYRGPRGKSAIGALIPDAVYVTSMEGKNVHHWLAAHGSEYDPLRERLGGVTPSLLDELQDLHDRIGSCMPSLYRHLAVDGAQRIAQSFKLSMKLVRRCAAYQHLRGPRIPWTPSPRAIPAAARAAEVAPVANLVAPPAAEVASALNLIAAPAPNLAATPTANLAPAPNLAVARTLDLFAAPAPNPAVARTPDLVAALAPNLAATLTPNLAAVPAPNLAATPAPDLAAAPAPNLAATPAPDLTAAAPTSAPAPAPASAPPTQRSQDDDLDLIARGIARAIAASRGHDQRG